MHSRRAFLAASEVDRNAMLSRRAAILVLIAALPTIGGCAAGSARRERLALSVETWSEAPFAGRRLLTPHFELISTVRDADFEAALPAFLEAAYQSYGVTLAPPRESESRMSTYLFGSRSEWVRFSRRRFPERFEVYSRIRSGGFTEGGTAVIFYLDRAATLATLAHEGWHQYVQAHRGGAIPAWLDEGLACYHEAVDYSGDEPRFTPLANTFRVGSLREAAATGRLMPLSALIGTDAGRVIRDHNSALAQSYYAQTWALVTMLRHGADGRYVESFERMLREISDGSFAARLSAERLTGNALSDTTRNDALFRAYFGCSPVDLEEDYEQHVLSLTGL